MAQHTCAASFFCQGTEQAYEGEGVLSTLLRITGTATLKELLHRESGGEPGPPSERAGAVLSPLGKPHIGTDYLPDGTSKSLQQVMV